MKNRRLILSVCGFAFCVNFTLFAVKLYIGLRTNSISIYSDAVNNLFDSFSGLITLICMFLIIRHSGSGQEMTVNKSEQLFSFLMAIIVMFAGFYFGYCSLERLMYPTPIWFTPLYAGVLAGTAAVKVLMFFFYGRISKKTDSPIVRVMKYDCVLDFFITLMTVIGLVVSKNGTYSFDAVLGLVISVIIVVSAIKMIVSSGKALVNYVGAQERENLADILEENGLKYGEISFITDGEKTVALIESASGPEADTEKIKNECKEKLGMEIRYIN